MVGSRAGRSLKLLKAYRHSGLREARSPARIERNTLPSDGCRGTKSRSETHPASPHNLRPYGVRPQKFHACSGEDPGTDCTEPTSGRWGRAFARISRWAIAARGYGNRVPAYGAGWGGLPLMMTRPATRTPDFFQRASTAIRAISERRSGLSFFARAGPPFSPPSRPRNAAAALLASSSKAPSSSRSWISLRSSLTLGSGSF